MRLWAMRNTAHLVATDDLPFIRPLFAPLMAAFNRRRLAHFGVDSDAQDRLLSLISKELARHGPLTRKELSQRIEQAGTPMDAQRHVHIFPLAVSTGLACMGPGDSGGTLVAAGDWLRRTLPTSNATPHSPSSPAATSPPSARPLKPTIAGWAGLPLGDVRAGIAAVADGLREVSIRGATAWQPKGRAPRPVPTNLVRLLPAFDTYLMGHRDREFIAPAGQWTEIGPGGGILRPAITVGGAAVGTWRLRRAGGKLASELLPFASLDRRVSEAIEAELRDIARFEGAAEVRPN